MSAHGEHADHPSAERLAGGAAQLAFAKMQLSVGALFYR
jgi:hypothetical protein